MGNATSSTVAIRLNRPGPAYTRPAMGSQRHTQDTHKMYTGFPYPKCGSQEEVEQHLHRRFGASLWKSPATPEPTKCSSARAGPPPASHWSGRSPPFRKSSPQIITRAATSCLFLFPADKPTLLAELPTRIEAEDQTDPSIQPVFSSLLKPAPGCVVRQFRLVQYIFVCSTHFHTEISGRGIKWGKKRCCGCIGPFRVLWGGSVETQKLKYSIMSVSCRSYP